MSPFQQGFAFMKSFVKGTTPKAPVRLVSMVHAELQQRVQIGDVVIDATVGNGYDTMAMAEWVGACGLVIGFDIQPKAIVSTRTKLASLDLLDRVKLHCNCHSLMSQYVTRPISAIVFNLGYLPGGDHTKTTQVYTTLSALEASLSLLKPNGLLSVVTYPGHIGGVHERNAVAEWMSSKTKGVFRLKSMLADPTKRHSPEWFLLEY